MTNQGANNLLKYKYMADWKTIILFPFYGSSTKLYNFFCGKPVGEDEFGNRYYTEKKTAKHGRTKRWVIYNGVAEPSKVPARWHGWLHYTLDTPPAKNGMTYGWEKPHLPNLTGTKNAYVPSGSLLTTQERAKTVADYEAWTPK
jgi:NADH:ubiquinone oxidoreductase subunit